MRTAILIAGLAMTSSVIAQIPLPAFGYTYTANQTRGYWFQAPVGFTIQGLQVPNEAGQFFQVVEVIDLGAAPPPAYPGTVTGTQLFYSNSVATGNIIPCGIPIAPGAYIGILGACTSSVGNATSYNSYAGALGPFVSNILGNPVTLTRFGTQSGIASNGGNQPCWQEAAYNISRVEMYVGTGSGGFALAQPYGVGCYDGSRTVYENFANATSFDLANSAFLAIFTGNAYTFVQSGSYVPPSLNATVLQLSDDSEVSVVLSSPLAYPGGTTTTLTVCSNGFVSPGVGNGTSYTPDPIVWCASTLPRWGVSWHDYNPTIAGSGQVKYEEVGTVSYVTWDGVFDYATTGPGSTFQLQFDRAGGFVTYAYGTFSGIGNAHLVGYAGGGTSRNLGSRDISASLPATFSTTATDSIPLTLTASGRPRIGTSINLVSSNVPTGSPLGATIFGLAEITAGINLVGLGMPDCFQYLSLDATVVFLPSGGTGTQPFTVPNVPGLAGVIMLAQSAAFAPGVNALGILSSNGMRLTIDVN
jgi:hypothetical protein